MVESSTFSGEVSGSNPLISTKATAFILKEGGKVVDLKDIDLSSLDLKALENMPRSALTQLQSMLTPKLTQYIPHVPTPKQTAFMLLDGEEAFYGGAAGGGKSDALLMCGLQYVDVKGYSGIIFRKNFSDLVKPGALIDRAREWLTNFPEVRWVDKEKKFVFRKMINGQWVNWSTLQFGYLETDNDRFNYQGGEYQFIGFDELTHISEVCYTYLFSRMRRLKDSNVPLRVRGASNPPDDDQGIWVYNRFVNPETKKKDVVFISAGLDDNPFLDKESYVKALDKLDAVSRARLKDGNWEIQRKGNMFKENWFEIVQTPPPVRRRMRFWDMASTDDAKKVKRKSDPDYTVGALVSEHAGIFYIEDIIRVRKTPQVTEQIQKVACISDGYNTAIREEQEPGSSGDAIISLKSRGIFSGYNYKGIRSTGNKALRAQAFSALAEQGNVKILATCRNREAFIGEAESFPGGLHDDMVDAISGAINELRTTPPVYIPIPVSGTGSYWDGISNDYSDYGIEHSGMSTMGTCGYWNSF